MTHNSYWKRNTGEAALWAALLSVHLLVSMNATVQMGGFDSDSSVHVGDAPIICFVFFPPFAAAGNWRGVHRILPLPPSFASLIIAGVIEIRIKRVEVKVGDRGGRFGGMHEWRKIQKTMSTILKRSVFLLRSTSFLLRSSSTCCCFSFSVVMKHQKQ